MTVAKYIEQCTDRAFEWGTFDCCIYAAGAIELATGRNPMEGCPIYNSEVSASIALYKKYNERSIRQVFLKIVEEFNAQQVHIADMQDGDLACVKWPHEFTNSRSIDQSYGMGVVFANRVLVCSNHGLIAVPSTHRIVDIWRFK